MSDRAKARDRPVFFKRPELIIAEKEFRDHFTSKRFIVVFGILLLLALNAVTMGMDAYNKKLDVYKNPEHDPDYLAKQQAIDNYQQTIEDAEAQGEPPENYQWIYDQIDQTLNPAMPSILEVFQSMIWLFTYMGMILGVAMGFDQISREKDEGSLKFLASSPTYRDAIINGKTIGAIAVLAVATGAAFSITVAVVLIMGIIPSLEDLIRIALFFVAVLLYCMVFFAIAMMLSTITRNTAMSAVTTVGAILLLALFSLMAIEISGPIATAIAGPAPSAIDYHLFVGNGTSQGYEESAAYWNRQSTITRQVSDILTTISPINDFGGMLGNGGGAISGAILSKPDTLYYTYSGIDTSFDDNGNKPLPDALAGIWTRVLALMIEIGAAFGIAYVAFMRTDIR